MKIVKVLPEFDNGCIPNIWLDVLCGKGGGSYCGVRDKNGDKIYKLIANVEENEDECFKKLCVEMYLRYGDKFLNCDKG